MSMLAEEGQMEEAGRLVSVDSESPAIDIATPVLPATKDPSSSWIGL